MDIIKIREHYYNVISESDKFNSTSPVRDTGLLLPEFRDILGICFKEYEEQYHGQEIFIVETYRSNELQARYYRNGSSKIRKNGMHHFGLAIDAAFIINGKFSYKGDYKLLRKIFTDNGLTVLKWELGHVQFVKVEEQEEVRGILDN